MSVIKGWKFPIQVDKYTGKTMTNTTIKPKKQKAKKSKKAKK